MEQWLKWGGDTDWRMSFLNFLSFTISFEPLRPLSVQIIIYLSLTKVMMVCICAILYILFFRLCVFVFICFVCLSSLSGAVKQLLSWTSLRVIAAGRKLEKLCTWRSKVNDFQYQLFKIIRKYRNITSSRNDHSVTVLNSRFQNVFFNFSIQYAINNYNQVQIQYKQNLVTLVTYFGTLFRLGLNTYTIISNYLITQTTLTMYSNINDIRTINKYLII